MLFDDASALRLILIAGPLILASAWMLASPGRVVSREMTWDLLFNLNGAWHLHNGHTAHVDFHDPLGRLNFLLTEIGFRFLGPSVRAFLFGELIVAAAIFVAATAAAVNRLPLLPAVLFVLFACQLILIPINIGDLVTSYSFAMSYNSYCWSAAAILSLILFLPPRGGRGVAWLDAAVTGGLLVGLYFLKLTYFAAAMFEVGVALLVSRHVQQHYKTWCAVGLAVALNAVAPYNWAYLGDFWTALGAGAARANPTEQFITLFANTVELSLYTTGLVIAAMLWRAGQAPLRLPVAIGLMILIGMAVLSQNAQSRGIPLGLIVSFLLYDWVRGSPAIGSRRLMAGLMLALMVLPVAYVVRTGAIVAGYHYKATRGSSLFVIDRTNLRGLAVPSEPDGILSAFSSGQIDYTMFNRSRSVGPRYEMSQYEYIQTILEAADLFQSGRLSGGAVLLDQVNPLPFMLGRPPLRGANLWMDDDFPAQPAERLFAEADYVLVPKFATNSTVTGSAIGLYGTYLTRHFPHRIETRSWIVLARRPLPA